MVKPSSSRSSRVVLVLGAALALACADSAAPQAETQDSSCASAQAESQEQQRQQLALLYRLVEIERQLSAIEDELRRSTDESFFAALERQQGVLREEHAKLVDELDQLLRASANGASPHLPPKCASIQACFGLEGAKLAL